MKPGCDALQSLESEVNGLLGKVRENCGKEALGALSFRNSPLCMAQCGSKGSPLNISQVGLLNVFCERSPLSCVLMSKAYDQLFFFYQVQPFHLLTPINNILTSSLLISPLKLSQMIACLGQQSVGGARIQDGFVGRTLPHFPIGALYPAAKGFVANSFFSGLTGKLKTTV